MVKMIVRIDGMRCGMYEAHICGAVRRELPVKKVAASRRKGQAVLLMNENIPAQRVRDVIEATGRRVLSMMSQP